MVVTIDADRVLDRVNLDEADGISKEEVETLIADVLVEIERELDITLGELSGDVGSMSLDVNKIYAPVITNLSALYVLAHITGGSAAGTECQIGALNPQAVAKATSVDFLQAQVAREIEHLKPIPFIIGEADS